MPQDAVPLPDLLSRILLGETDLFLHVVRRFELGVRSYLASQLYNQTEVDDLAQEVFITAFRDLKSFRHGEDFGAWLRGIARNRLLTHFRAQQRRDSAVERFREDIARRLASDLDAAARKEDADFVARLLLCIARLPAKLRKVVHSGLEGTRSATLARELGTSVGAVYQLHYRANQLLRECLGREVPE